jgi:signal transduction histidine kinase
MTLSVSTSSLRKKLVVVRWVLPLVLATVVIFYETLEHIVHGSEPISADFVTEIGFFGVLGPTLVLLGLSWLIRNLLVQEQAEAEIRHLNATLEQQVEERTRSLQQTYEELEEKNRELQTLDQLKSEFVSLVSHELRAPLTNINGGIELLLSGQELSPHCRDTLGILGEQSQRLTNLVETILSISAIEARRWPLTPGPVALPPLVRTVARAMMPRAGLRRIQWRGVDDLPFAWADEDSVAQVLTNLLDNAIKHSPEGSDIAVDAEATGDEVRIAVDDEGPGIPPEERERVFDRFHRLDSRDNRKVYGHGLGLYMARLLLEAQDGRIWVEGDHGQGTRFVISLPQVREAAK